MLDPARQENKTGFLAETGRLFTLYNPGMGTCASSSHYIHVGKLLQWGGGGGGVPEGVGDNSNPPAVRERKQDFSFCFSIRGGGGELA